MAIDINKLRTSVANIEGEIVRLQTINPKDGYIKKHLQIKTDIEKIIQENQ